VGYILNYGSSQTGGGGSGGGGGTVGPAINYAPAGGIIDPNIAGFTASTSTSAGTGRIRITLAANTSFEGLPFGGDGQLLVLVVVSGGFLLQLLPLNGATAQAQILAANPYVIPLNGAFMLVYDKGLTQWILLP